MLVPISEQVFIPIHRIERISFFGTTATVKIEGQRDPERLENEDAQRLMKFVRSLPGLCEKPDTGGKARR